MTNFARHLFVSALSISMAASISTAPAWAHDAPRDRTASQAPASVPTRARNIIVFLADAGGVSSLNAASLMAYGEPLKLHVQQWPNLGLSETSPVDQFVSDSANGMSSIMTGVKTRNGVISQSPTVVRGRQDGAPTKTLAAEVQARVDLDDTLLLFTADHSFGLQVDGGRRGEPLLEGYDAWKAAGGDEDVVRLKNVLVNRTHTAEEVPALAIGAGAEQIRGYFPNTHLFNVMMNAWGWKPDASTAD